MGKKAPVNVIYISYDGMTDPLGQSQVLPYLVGLSAIGFRFTLVSFEKTAQFSLQEAKIREICKNSEINWQPLTYTKNPPILSTVYDLIKLFFTCLLLYRQHRFRIVHCRSFIASLVGLLLKKLTGCKFIFDMRGFWIDDLVDGGVLKNQLLYKILKQLEFMLIRNADAVTLLTQNGIDEMKRWKQLVSVNTEKYYHITTCVDLEKFESVYQFRRRKDFDENKIEFLYVGSIGPWHSAEKVTAFIDAAYKHFPDSRFKLIVGAGRESLEKILNEKNYAKERFDIKTVPHYAIYDEFKTADIGFFFIPPAYAKIASCPTKTGEMLAAGIPVITGNLIGDVDNLITENRIGKIIEEVNEVNLTQAIAEIVEMLKTERLPLMERCVTTADDYFSLTKGTKKYEKIYRKIINE